MKNFLPNSILDLVIEILKRERMKKGISTEHLGISTGKNIGRIECRISKNITFYSFEFICHELKIKMSDVLMEAEKMKEKVEQN